ncbi:phage tail assembly chaperone [Pseudomonas sp. PH1b]|uniref:phage tail assembly chaperone n=1 Tax=Pseudomonas sp. PH1b TaxID=1397282 RepID=UPI00046AA8B5|nr:phage tail assembly chaperone [Pseudomonas sp. PH1b]
MEYFIDEKNGALFAYDDADAAEEFAPKHLKPISEQRAKILIEALNKPLPISMTVKEREWRDAELTAVMWLRERHRDQLEIEAPATLTGEQYKELLVYMQALRDWPQSTNFPDIQQRPSSPTWVAGQIE